MLWNQFTKDVHQNAVEHGWWDEERSFGEIVSLCHSELSEALEEFRAKRPMVWQHCQTSPVPCVREGCGDWCDGVCEINALDKKPDGIAVELADCIIRILDWFGVRGLDTDAYLAAGKRYSKREMPESIGDVIAELHYDLSLAFGTKGRRDVYLAVCVNEIMLWAQQMHGTEGRVILMADCKWMQDEVCVNDQCPMCCDYCPVPDNEGVCRFEERGDGNG